MEESAILWAILLLRSGCLQGTASGPNPDILEPRSQSAFVLDSILGCAARAMRRDAVDSVTLGKQ